MNESQRYYERSERKKKYVLLTLFIKIKEYIKLFMVIKIRKQSPLMEDE